MAALGGTATFNRDPSSNLFLSRIRFTVKCSGTRWGTPTGKYSSGTEEEFEVARCLNEKTGSRPYMILYFKLVSEEAANPDEQLQQVRSFRERIKQDFLFHEFNTTAAWAQKFRKHLGGWLDSVKKLPTRIIELKAFLIQQLRAIIQISEDVRPLPGRKLEQRVEEAIHQLEAITKQVTSKLESENRQDLAQLFLTPPTEAQARSFINEKHLVYDNYEVMMKAANRGFRLQEIIDKL